MGLVKQLTCALCGVSFQFKGRTRAKYCVACRKIAQRRRSYEHRVKTGSIKHPGVGSGGAQFGTANHQWKGGVHIKYTGNYRKRCFRVWDRRCVICGCTSRICVHHIDGDVHNYKLRNLVPLCHRCHWAVHGHRKLSRRVLERRLFELWLDGRSKIAEKIGNAEKPIRGEGAE